jgi:SAM-dependent methyltransferase
MKKFKESATAHRYLDGLKGIEIGGSAHNAFGLDTINVDRYESMETIYKKAEFELCGEKMKVDILAEGHILPFADKSFDFVINSHVLEHIYDPIAALIEWKRVARQYIFCVIPHKDRTFDRHRPLTTWKELLERHHNPQKDNTDTHWTVWTTQSFLEMIPELNKISPGFQLLEYLDVDDKVGNGFTIIFEIN